MKLAIEGMHCQKCVERVRKAIEGVPGVSVENVDVGSATVKVDGEGAAGVIDAVRAAGYEVRVG